MNRLGKMALARIFKSLDHVAHGHLSLTTPDGKTRIFNGKQAGPHADIVIHDWRVILNLAHQGDIGFAEDYRAGHWTTKNLVNLLEFALGNNSISNQLAAGGILARLAAALSYMRRINTLRGSKKNIHAHYDLGNHFYRLWLDPSMTYSSALFAGGARNLMQAQHAKYDRILDCMGAASGRMLDIGCGWGGFAQWAAQRGDYDIKGITLSRQQHEYARQRLGKRARIALEDYRHQQGKYEHIVSIEMFEAVGERYWKNYFSKIAALLHNNGKAVIQTITIDDRHFARYRRSGDFIRSYIFPGGMLPSPSRFTEEAARAGLKTGQPFFFGRHYATTLLNWLDNFDSRRADIMTLGFDESFIRLWRFYLAACAAGFKAGRTDVMQVELSHGA